MTSRKPKEQIHKIFAQCAEVIPDQSWRDFFNDCSYGKFPKGIRFDNGILKCVRPKLTFTEVIPTDVLSAVKVLMRVFHDKLNIKTTRERKNSSLKFEQQREDMRIKSWAEATTIASRDCLLRAFVHRYCKELMLPDRAFIDILTLLKLALSNKSLKKEMIIFEDYRIVSIVGLHYDHYTKIPSLEVKFKPEPLKTTWLPLDYALVPQFNFSKHEALLFECHHNRFTANDAPETIPTQ